MRTPAPLRHTVADVCADRAIVARIMALWDVGCDTAEIASLLCLREYVVAYCVAKEREQRRGEP